MNYTADYKLTPLERETIILWNEAEDDIYIDTCDPGFIKRLKNANKTHPNIFRVDPPNKYGIVSAVVSKEALRVSLHPPMSDEKRKKLSAQAKEWQAKYGV